NSKAKYIMFAVDDMIITHSVDLSVCVEALEKYKAWFFSLRLGKNITFCDLESIAIQFPQKGKKKGTNILLWKFKHGVGDWNYPNTTDLSIYRKADLKYTLKYLDYTNPNTLEGAWFHKKPKRKKGLSFNYSRAFNLPLNIVNPYWSSPNQNISAQELLD